MDSMESIKTTFFQECDELLGDMEQSLLALEAGEGDSDTINAVFRAVHSVKGGAGAFGFEKLVGFAHVFETTLDAMRSGALDVTSDGLKILLRASDVLNDLVQNAKGLGDVDEGRVGALAEELESMVAPEDGEAAADEPEEDWGFKPVTLAIGADAPAAGWTLHFKLTAAMFANGHDASVLLNELARLGAADVKLDASALPPFDAIDPEGAFLSWMLTLPAQVEENAIRDVFDFVGDEAIISLSRDSAAVAAPAPPSAEIVDIQSLIAQVKVTEERPAAVKTPEDHPKEAAQAKEGGGHGAQAGATIRVDLHRVDNLIDLVGELVINQAMLAQSVEDSGITRSPTVVTRLEEFEHLTREIQDCVMSIRAQPVKSVFQRMPRLVREIAASTGKQVRLVTDGEATEVDKTVIERIADPITHMLRNAIDHGVETPDERTQAGKPAEGVVRLAAFHRSGRIVIEVSDDGKGINRPRVKEIAVNKGLIQPDADLTDDEIDNLIFLPGFSTAAVVSNISGRGVGMDVVKRSIQGLGGRISITSNPGKGSTFTLSLPLTLAVLDGMVVMAGDQTLVAPLTAIIETLKPKQSDIRHLGPKGAVIAVRGGYLPIIDVGVALGWRNHAIDPVAGVILLIESEIGGRAALLVDAIQGQRQVVIKSLEANFQKVEAVAAATILGDGRVALILDIDAIIATKLRDVQSAPLLEAS
jgi:two-component system, chemotaxis family, sensor kinase CheA